MIKSKSKSLCLLSGSLLLALACTQAPAQAYYYPFSYRGLGMLYPLRYLAYPLIGGGGPYSAYNSATIYRRLTGGVNGYPYPYMYGPQMMKNYTDQEPLNAPRKRVKQKRAGQEFGVDEVTHAQWANGEDDARDDFTTPPLVQPAMPQDASAALPPQNPLYSQAPQGNPLLPQGGAPPVAPPVASRQPVALAPNLRNAALGAVPAGMSAPIADGFVNRVNTKFGGDIKAALFDPDTRGWAKLLGLTSDDKMFVMDFSEARVALIKQLMADTSLDSVSKLNAVKILLGGGANRATP